MEEAKENTLNLHLHYEEGPQNTTKNIKLKADINLGYLWYFSTAFSFEDFCVMVQATKHRPAVITVYRTALISLIKLVRALITEWRVN